MWYLRKAASSCEQFGRVSTSLCPKYTSNFHFKIWEMVEKIKTDVDKLLLVLTMNTIFPIYIAKIELFLNFVTKSSLFTSVFIFNTIYQILKWKFYVYFEHKNVET